HEPRRHGASHCLGPGPLSGRASGDSSYSISRERMIEKLLARGVRDSRVIAAMGAVPRHCFVPEALVAKAYGDHALPIGEKQTISQPYVVARMSELLHVGE